MPSVFLSHSSKDKSFVRRLAADLAKSGLSVWIDEAELDIGDSLIQRIAEGVYKSDFIAAVISRHSAKSQWVQKELQLAMTREIEGKRIRVLPILLDRCKDEIPFFLRDKVYADFSTGPAYQDEFKRLLRGIAKRSNSSCVEAAEPEHDNVGSVDIGSVIHDQGDDFLGFRLVRRKYRSGTHCLLLSVLCLFLCIVVSSNAPRHLLNLALGLSGGIMFYAGMTTLSATCLRESFHMDRNLLIRLEEVGEAYIAFTKNWMRQFNIGKDNHMYVAGKILEAMAHLCGIAGIVFGVLGIISCIVYLGRL